MSFYTMPVLIFNLGGEMLYILDQRLQAQKIPGEKCKKVLNDIVKTMLSDSFVQELFKPQILYPKNAVRQVFNKLAHSSIMKLNTTSMDKLFDLMTMAVKYQVSLCQRPQEIMYVALNHLDAILKYSENDKNLHAKTCSVFEKFVGIYSKLTPGQFQMLRYTLLTYFQDHHVRVSIFLKDGLQNERGRFILPTETTVPIGIEVPGMIRVYEKGDLKTTKEFKPAGKYHSFSRIPSIEKGGDRCTWLGGNIYVSSGAPAEDAAGDAAAASNKRVDSPKETKGPKAPKGDSASAKGELSFLENLLGKNPVPSNQELRVDVFGPQFDVNPVSEDAFLAPIRKEGGFIKIDVRRGEGIFKLKDEIKAEFSKALSSKPPANDDDLLALMDEAKNL